MLADEDIELSIRLLQAAGVAQAADEILPLIQLAQANDAAPSSLELAVEQLEQMGLLLGGLEEGQCPILLTAGRQYLDRRGDVPNEVLRFLPRIVDDLNARDALIHAGTILVDEFRDRLLSGGGVEQAVELVPPAFAPAVDQELALNLFAAAVALMTHLSDRCPASCLAEEIIAVRVIQEAECFLEARVEKNELSEGEMKAATEELKGVFELFEDDDVLDLFEMREPGDAALAGEGQRNQEMGVVDQRIEAWFEPFGWATPTGYLGR
jgi:hypothetical protein